MAQVASGPGLAEDAERARAVALKDEWARAQVQAAAAAAAWGAQVGNARGAWTPAKTPKPRTL